jgi:toxin ParE1/3/4
MTEPAANDLRANLHYIAENLQNPIAAKRLFAEYEKTTKFLVDMPYVFALVHDEYLAKRGIRSVPVKNYQVFYSIQETDKKVLILRFLYGRRDWQHILKNTAPEKV